MKPKTKIIRAICELGEKIVIGEIGILVTRSKPSHARESRILEFVVELTAR